MRELYLGDRQVSLSLLERWVVAKLFVECHFPSVLWPLAGDVQWITCSLIVLTLDIHVFRLHAEAEGAILYTTKKVWGMHSEFNISCGRGQASLLLHLCRKFALQNVAGLNGFDPRTDFVLGGVRIDMGCMNLVTVISRHTPVPVTLISYTGLMQTQWQVRAHGTTKERTVVYHANAKSLSDFALGTVQCRTHMGIQSGSSTLKSGRINTNPVPEALIKLTIHSLISHHCMSMVTHSPH